MEPKYSERRYIDFVRNCQEFSKQMLDGLYFIYHYLAQFAYALAKRPANLLRRQ